jgi:ribonuclease-3
MTKKTEALERQIGYSFQDKSLLIKALTHSSYANEKKLGKLGCNERLEFLGDAVLELVSSDYLFGLFPDLPEGELTKKRASLVCEPSLAYCARAFSLPAGFEIPLFRMPQRHSWEPSIWMVVLLMQRSSF